MILRHLKQNRNRFLIFFFLKAIKTWHVSQMTQMFKIRQIFAFCVLSFDHKQGLNINIYFFKLKKRKQPCRRIVSEILLKLELKLLKSNISYQQTRSQFSPRNG